ncbi:MAG: DoxX family protein [Pyrinomonadaceae bacterium]|nr:DoxX family protein [Pyrinomonadaceae bacterium]
MRSRKLPIIYWLITIFFALFMILDGLAGVLRVEGGKEALAVLGYPEYCLTILGLAKLFGSIAILQPSFRTIKEWAYAGFTFIFVGGFASHAFTGDGIGMLFPPLIMLGIMFVSYTLWKKIESERF